MTYLQILETVMVSNIFSFRYGKLVIPKEKRKMSVSPLPSPRSDGNTPMDSDAEDGPVMSKDDEVLSLLNIVKQAEANVDAVVEYLVDNGADLNSPDMYGMTPMHHAAMVRSIFFLFVLLLDFTSFFSERQ